MTSVRVLRLQQQLLQALSLMSKQRVFKKHRHCTQHMAQLMLPKQMQCVLRVVLTVMKLSSRLSRLVQVLRQTMYSKQGCIGHHMIAADMHSNAVP